MRHSYCHSIIFYRGLDARLSHFVANISMYSLSLRLSKFVCDLRGVENIPNIEQWCKIGYRNMQTDVVAAVPIIFRVFHPVKYIVHNNKVEMISIQ